MLSRFFPAAALALALSACAVPAEDRTPLHDQVPYVGSGGKEWVSPEEQERRYREASLAAAVRAAEAAEQADAARASASFGEPTPQQRRHNRRVICEALGEVGRDDLCPEV